MIPVPIRIIAASALALAGAWTLGDLAFTIGLFLLAVLFAVWAVVEVAGGDS